MIFKFLVIVLLMNSKCFGHSLDNTVVTSGETIATTDYKHIPSDKSNDPTTDSSPDSNSSDNNNTEVPIRPDELPAVPTPSPPNDMLSFEEWRKKIAEKAMNKEQPSQKVPPQTAQQSHQSVPAATQSSTASKQKPMIKRARNFASYECGAKVVDANPESESVQRY